LRLEEIASLPLRPQGA